MCEHKNWIPAGYRENKNQYVRVQSIYEVFCKDCKKYINLLTGKDISNKGLIYKESL